jgi:hypothetical protein
MTTLRLAAVLFLVYALALVCNAALYISWSGDTSELPRGIVRVVGVSVVAVGLWRARRWAWWIAVILSGLLFVLGVTALISSGVLDSRPYLIADYVFFFVSLGALLGAVLALVLPGSRAAIRGAA